MRIYIDTSVIGGYYDPEFSVWSSKLFDEFRRGEKIAVVSDQTLRELEPAPQRVRALIKSIPEEFLDLVELDTVARLLAKQYIQGKVIAEKHLIDAQHIALATVNYVDFLASWNFKEMVNVFKIRQYNSVNLKHGYSMIDIRTPKELLHENEDI